MGAFFQHSKYYGIDTPERQIEGKKERKKKKVKKLFYAQNERFVHNPDICSEENCKNAKNYILFDLISFPDERVLTIKNII